MLPCSLAWEGVRDDQARPGVQETATIRGPMGLVDGITHSTVIKETGVHVGDVAAIVVSILRVEIHREHMQATS